MNGGAEKQVTLPKIILAIPKYKYKIKIPMEVIPPIAKSKTIAHFLDNRIYLPWDFQNSFTQLLKEEQFINTN